MTSSGSTTGLPQIGQGDGASHAPPVLEDAREAVQKALSTGQTPAGRVNAWQALLDRAGVDLGVGDDRVDPWCEALSLLRDHLPLPEEERHAWMVQMVLKPDVPQSRLSTLGVLGLRFDGCLAGRLFSPIMEAMQKSPWQALTAIFAQGIDPIHASGVRGGPLLLSFVDRALRHPSIHSSTTPSMLVKGLCLWVERGLGLTALCQDESLLEWMLLNMDIHSIKPQQSAFFMDQVLLPAIKEGRLRLDEALPGGRRVIDVLVEHQDSLHEASPSFLSEVERWRLSSAMAAVVQAPPRPRL